MLANVSLGAIVAGAVVLVGAAVSSGGGIGGGALYTPAFIVLLKDAHLAVPLSKIAIFGLAIAANLYNIGLIHPLSSDSKPRPLINIELCVLLELTTLVGSTLGVLLNVFLPSIVIVAILSVVLTATSVVTFRKAMRFWNCSMIQQASTPDDGQSMEAYPIPQDGLENKQYALLSSRDTTDQTRVSVGRPQRRSEIKRLLPHVLLLLFCVCVNATALIFGGGPRGLLCGSARQRTVLWVTQVFLMIFALGYRRYLLHSYRKWGSPCPMSQAEEELRTLQGEQVWVNSSRTLLYPFYSFLAGVAAGCLGIGGGLIKAPMMLEIGLLPQAATASAVFMILFTSSNTALQYALLGRLALQPALTVAALAFAGGFVGSRGVSMMVRRLEKGQALLTYLLGSLVLLSMLSLVGASVYSGALGNGSSHPSLEPHPHSSICDLLGQHPLHP